MPTSKSKYPETAKQAREDARNNKYDNPDRGAATIWAGKADPKRRAVYDRAWSNERKKLT